MLANINRDLLMVLLIAVPFVAVAMILFVVIRAVVKATKNNKYTEVKMIMLTIFLIIIAAASWIFNIGWFRFILTLMLVPFIHSIVFFAVNLWASKYIDKSSKLKKLNIVYCITYLLSYILLPDGGDVGGLYVFFGLIHNDIFAAICGGIFPFVVVAHVVVFILQIIQIIRTSQEITAQNDVDYE